MVELDARVVVVESHKLGSTCADVGCVKSWRMLKYWQVKGVKKTSSGLELSMVTLFLDRKPSLTTIPEVDYLLWAIGWDPNSRGLNLNKVGIQTDNKGHIIVDEFQNTNIRVIYAVGEYVEKIF